jgi:outer membrane usher protein
MNYDLYALHAPQGADGADAWSELRAFSGAGTLSSTALTRAVSRPGLGPAVASTRLDTTLSASFPEAMLTMRLGDTLSGALDWSRPTRIAGFQLSTNFALQPYRLTAPMPAFVGSAMLPSDVELYVNGLRQYTGKVPAGPFQLNASPAIDGAGAARVVLTDMLGRTTTLDFPVYAARGLLQAGLSDWTVDLGAVRRSYGVRSFDYGREPAASATLRRGLSDTLTFETHAEATNGLLNAGVGATLSMGMAGVLSASASASRDQGRAGGQFGVGYDWRNERWDVALGTRRAGDAYADVATRYGSVPVVEKTSITAGCNGARAGTLGLSYVSLRYAAQAPSRFAGITWFKTVGRATSVNVGVLRDLVNGGPPAVYIGTTMSFDGDIAVSTGAQQEPGRQISVDAGRAAPSEGGFGWRAGLRRTDDDDGGLAQVDYVGRYGRIGAGIYDVGPSRYAYGSASGALVLMAGSLFAARRIDDAFAVVSTGGTANVPVTIENRRIGVTGTDGLLLVTPLRAYENNRIGIDAMALPADVRIDRVTAVATPSDRAGIVVRFGIAPVRAASISLVDAAGRPVPGGSLVRRRDDDGDGDGDRDGGDEPAMVGFDGVVYLEGLSDENSIDVQTPAGRCTAAFPFHVQAAGASSIGPVTCRGSAA